MQVLDFLPCAASDCARFAAKKEAVATTAAEEPMISKAVGLNFLTSSSEPKTTSGTSKSGRRGLNMVRGNADRENVLPVAGENGRTISQVIRMRRQISDPELKLGYSTVDPSVRKGREDSIDVELKSLIAEVEKEVSAKPKK